MCILSAVIFLLDRASCSIAQSSSVFLLLPDAGQENLACTSLYGPGSKATGLYIFLSFLYMVHLVEV